MKIPLKGQRVYDHSAEDIYNVIIDLPVIAEEFTIIEKIERTSPDNYLFTINIHLPFTSGSYVVNVIIKDRNPFESLKMEGKHKSSIGKFTINLEGTIHPVGKSAHDLVIAGTLDIGGMLRFAGSGLLKVGVSNGIKLMFDLLGKKLAEKNIP